MSSCVHTWKELRQLSCSFQEQICLASMSSLYLVCMRNFLRDAELIPLCCVCEKLPSATCKLEFQQLSESSKFNRINRKLHFIVLSHMKLTSQLSTPYLTTRRKCTEYFRHDELHRKSTWSRSHNQQELGSGVAYANNFKVQPAKSHCGALWKSQTQFEMSKKWRYSKWCDQRCGWGKKKTI